MALADTDPPHIRQWLDDGVISRRKINGRWVYDLTPEAQAALERKRAVRAERDGSSTAPSDNAPIATFDFGPVELVEDEPVWPETDGAR